LCGAVTKIGVLTEIASKTRAVRAIVIEVGADPRASYGFEAQHDLEKRKPLFVKKMVLEQKDNAIPSEAVPLETRQARKGSKCRT
jgi:hypothetical protein